MGEPVSGTVSALPAQKRYLTPFPSTVSLLHFIMTTGIVNDRHQGNHYQVRVLL